MKRIVATASALLMLIAVTAQVATAQTPDSHVDRVMVYGESTKIWSCWIMTKKQAKNSKSQVEVKVGNKWKKVATAKITKSAADCGKDYKLTYKWKVNQLGTQNLTSKQTDLEMREVLKVKGAPAEYNYWVQQVYRSQSDLESEYADSICKLLGTCP